MRALKAREAERLRPYTRALLSSLVLLLLGFMGPAAGDRIALPDIGASAGTVLTPIEQQRMGLIFMRSVRAALPLVEDPLLEEYIQDLGNRLAGYSGTDSGHFTFFLIDQPVVNAFAGPGGYIGVYTGLVLATEGESELASVVAHEIAHVTQHHLMRAFERENQISGPATALLVAAAILGAAVSPQAGVATLSGAQAVAAQQQINFTRQNEKEADRVGINTLAEAGYDPHAMPVFFQRLAKSSRLYANNAPEFLLTHPVTSNRIADALGRADTYPYRQHPEDPRYYLTRATLQERAFDDPADAVHHFERTLAEGRFRNADAQHYGYALALLRARQYGKARQQATGLLLNAQEQPAYILLDAQIDRKTGKTSHALDTLEKALQLFPGNYPLTMGYGETLIEAGKPKQAEAVLERTVASRPANAAIYALLARAAGDARDLVNAYRYRAEYLYLNGNLEAAVQQLEVAQRQKDPDFYQSAQIAARLRDFKSELKEYKKLER